MKGKQKPADVDLIVLLRSRDYEKIENSLYTIKKIGDSTRTKVHAEPLVVDDMHKQNIYTSLLHEGYSIKHGKFLHKMLGFSSWLLITYDLKNKTSSEKVRFSYALYGRKKGDGLLAEIRGKDIGKGAILIPVSHQEEVMEFFKLWNVKHRQQRVTTF